MNKTIAIFLCLLIGYAFGNILFADLIAKIQGVNLFEEGSGNPGMANTGRVLGKKSAALVLLGDILKTAIPIAICRAVFPMENNMEILYAGLGATLGHDFPFWHHFDGGKGVTCICATIILFSPLWGILSCLAGLLIVVWKKDLKLGACIISILFAIFMGIFSTFPAFLVSIILAALMILKNATPDRIPPDQQKATAGLKAEVEAEAGMNNEAAAKGNDSSKANAAAEVKHSAESAIKELPEKHPEAIQVPAQAKDTGNAAVLTAAAAEQSQKLKAKQ